MTQKLNAELERDEGRGTRDGMKWEGEIPAEPKRQRVANGEQRVVFLEGSALALPKIFGTSGDVPSSITEKFFRRIRRCALQNFSPKEFGAQKNLSNPMSLAPCPSLAKASGMGRKNRERLHLALSTPHFCAIMHACTHLEHSGERLKTS